MMKKLNAYNKINHSLNKSKKIALKWQTFSLKNKKSKSNSKQKWKKIQITKNKLL